MTSTRLRRKAILLLLTSILAFPWAASAGSRLGSARSVAPSTSAFLDILGRAWTFLTSDRNKEGCHLDPDGLCAPGSPKPTIQTDTGCHLDPNGGCRD